MAGTSVIKYLKTIYIVQYGDISWKIFFTKLIIEIIPLSHVMSKLPTAIIFKKLTTSPVLFASSNLSFYPIVKVGYRQNSKYDA